MVVPQFFLVSQDWIFWGVLTRCFVEWPTLGVYVFPSKRLELWISRKRYCRGSVLFLWFVFFPIKLHIKCLDNSKVKLEIFNLTFIPLPSLFSLSLKISSLYWFLAYPSNLFKIQTNTQTHAYIHAGIPLFSPPSAPVLSSCIE